MPVTAPSWAPCLPPGTANLARALDELMWVIQVERNYFGSGLEIRGCVKSKGETEGQILAGFLESLEEILDVLDQADMELCSFPEYTIDQPSGGGLRMQLCLTLKA